MDLLREEGGRAHWQAGNTYNRTVPTRERERERKGLEGALAAHSALLCCALLCLLGGVFIAIHLPIQILWLAVCMFVWMGCRLTRIESPACLPPCL